MIKIMEFLGRTNSLSKPHRGLVVDNNDPKKLQRVRCTIDGLMNGPVETLPWIYPQNPPGFGARQDIGSMTPPSVNSELVIEFPTEDIYAAFYTGTWQSKDTHPGTFDEDYPNSYGFTDDAGNTFRVNKAKRFSEWNTGAGSRIRFDGDSTIELRSRKAINLVSEDGKTKFTFDLENGTVNLSPKQGMVVEGLEHKIAPQKLIIDTGTVDETVSGAKITKVLSGHKLSVGGQSAESIVGSKGVAIGGSESTIIAGSKEETIGQGSKQTIVTLGEEKKILQGDSSLEIALGSALLKILAGNIEFKTLAGSAEMGNAIAKLIIGLSGSVELSNALGSMKISPAGAIAIKSILTAEFAGTAQTKVGSSAGLTEVNGSIIGLGGSAGLPVARVGDMCVGVGNLGIPVMSTIIMGSFKVLAS